MRGAPGTSPFLGFPLAGVLVFLLAVAVIGGTAYGWTRWQQDIETATDSAVATSTTKPTPTTLPTAPTSGPEEDPQSAEADEPPTFDLLRPTDNRPRPVVLVLGDGYAAGRGASSPERAFPALIGSELGWDVRTEAAIGAGYVSAPPTLLDLLAEVPGSFTPDLVVVQGAYGSDAPHGEATTAVEELATVIATRWPDAPVVALTPWAPGSATPQVKTRERTLARAWREDPDTLVLRPLVDGWSDATQDDAGHRLITEELVAAFRAAGLAKPA